MADPFLLAVVGCGALLALGLTLAVLGLHHRPVRLADAMGQLAGGSAVHDAADPAANDLRLADTDVASRLGGWAFVRLGLPLNDRTRRVLALQGRSIGDFVAERLIYLLLGLTFPLLAVAALQGLGHLVGPLPLGASLLFAAAGWTWPEIAVRRRDEVVRSDANEALYTYLDLVTLERMSNASATQALRTAAEMSQTPLFRRITGALDRARLEQRPPWTELRKLSDQLHLPQLADLVDVMKLDEQGAALVDALRARVAELRDAHLMDEKLAAQKVSERMTIWMVIPSMVFGLVFLVPPVLKLLGMDG